MTCGAGASKSDMSHLLMLGNCKVKPPCFICKRNFARIFGAGIIGDFRALPSSGSCDRQPTSGGCTGMMHGDQVRTVSSPESRQVARGPLNCRGRQKGTFLITRSEQ